MGQADVRIDSAVPREKFNNKRIYLNLDLCCGCQSCAAACCYGHFIQSLLSHAEISDDATLPLQCLHCDQPACAAACPNEAMKTMPDGLVLRSQFKCVGCSSCTLACPFGVEHTYLTRHTVPKCDLCVDRLAEGEIPRCVQSCTSGALSFEAIDDQAVDGKKNLASVRLLSNAIGRRR
jgi:formate dehydrogenase iron-sulfur subunit